MTDLEEDIKNVDKDEKLEQSLHVEYKNTDPVKGSLVYLYRSYTH